MTSQKLVGLSSLLIAGGLASLCGGLTPTASTAQGLKEHPPSVSVEVRGHLDLPADVDPLKVHIHLHFPEVPLDVFRTGKELFPTPATDFSIAVHLKGVPRLFRCSLTASAPKMGQLKMDRLHLQAENQPSSDDGRLVCQLPTLRLPSLSPAATYTMPDWGGKWARRGVPSVAADPARALNGPPLRALGKSRS